MSQGVLVSAGNSRREIAKKVFVVTTSVAVALIISLLQSVNDSYYDLNLHYFSALVERDGSYTEFDRVKQTALQFVSKAPEEPVYGTPILVALIYVPLSYLSLHSTHIIWTIIWILVVGLALALALPNKTWVPVCALALMTSSAFIIGIHIANVSTVTFALLLICYAALRDERRGLAGLSLGIAIALKAYPAFLLLPLLIRRRWTELRHVFIVVVVATAITIPVLGLQDFITSVHHLIDVGQIVHIGSYNSSAPAIVARFTDDPTIARFASLSLMALGTALIVYMRKTATHVLFATAIGVMLISQTISWVHYFPLAMVMALVVFDMTRSIRVKVVATTALLLAMDFVAAPPGIFGPALRARCQLFGTAILLALIAYHSLKKHQCPDDEESTPPLSAREVRPIHGDS